MKNIQIVVVLDPKGKILLQMKNKR